MQKHQGSTNEVKQIKLSSAIEQVVWTRRVAAPGGTVGLEIYTRFVGNGADLQIELSDGQGRKHGTFKEQIAGNRFWAPIRMPEKAEQALVATAKLPKHGLEMTSPALLLTPPIEIKNLEWSQKEARRGDVLTLTADVAGAADGTEATMTIWEHDADGAHDLVTRISALVEGEKVEAEWEFVYVDDTDDIPTAEEAEKGYSMPEYFFRVDVGGVVAKSDVLPFTDWVELSLFDAPGQPLSEEEYVLRFADGTERRGKLDDEGYAREEGVPPGPVQVDFSVGDTS